MHIDVTHDKVLDIVIPPDNTSQLRKGLYMPGSNVSCGLPLRLVQHGRQATASTRLHYAESAAVNQALAPALAGAGIEPPRRSDTAAALSDDNGSEFAHHEKIAQALGVDVYFAHPYSAWERARNENMNGLLRQYLPKGTSFNGLTNQQVQRYVNALNNRPRKKQQFRTPNEVFEELRVALEV